MKTNQTNFKMRHLLPPLTAIAFSVMLLVVIKSNAVALTPVQLFAYAITGILMSGLAFFVGKNIDSGADDEEHP